MRFIRTIALFALPILACTGTEFDIPPIDTQPDAGSSEPIDDAGENAGNDAGNDADAGPQQYVVTTVAGTGTAGSVDSPTGASFGGGVAAPPTFNYPTGVAIAPDGNLYVADSTNNKIRKVNVAIGTVSTYAGTGAPTGITGASWDDGACASATFHGPLNIAVGTTGNVYVADNVNYAIRKITSDVETGCQVSTIASQALDPSFPRPGGGIAVDADENVYFTDYDQNTIRQVATDGTVTIIAGIPGTVGVDFGGANNGLALGSTFNHPSGIVVDKTNTFYVLDQGGHDLRQIAIAADSVTTLAGLPNQASGFIDGTGVNAAFNQPFGLAIDASGNLYVADTSNNAIRKVSPSGEVTTLAGLRDAAGTSISGYADGEASKARFSGPNGVAVDSNGVIYIADSGNNMIRKIAPAP